MEVGKTYKFVAGPYKGLVFTLKGRDDGLHVYRIKLAQRDREDAVSEALVNKWGTAEV